MSDFNQSEQLSFEFSEYPEMPSLLSKVIQNKQVVSDDTFDPHKLMMKKKLTDSGVTVDNTPIQTWPEKDIKALEDFCLKYGIIGFNCGKMHPIAALGMLKQQLGVIEPHESKVTYSDSMNKKMLLKG